MNVYENYLKIVLALFDRLQYPFTLSFAKWGDLRDGNTQADYFCGQSFILFYF